MKKIIKMISTMLVISILMCGCGIVDNNVISNILDNIVGDNVQNDITNGTDATTGANYELFSYDGVTVSVDKTSITDESIILKVDNTTNKDLIITCDAAAINHYMENASLYGTIKARKREDIKLYFSENILERSGMKEVGLIDLWLIVREADTKDKLYVSDKIVIETDAAENMDVVVLDEGCEIYNKDNLRVVAKEVVYDEKYDTTSLEMFIENNTEQNVFVGEWSVKINGCDVNGVFFEEVRPQKMDIHKLKFYESSLDLAGITDVSQIKEIEIELRITRENPVTGEKSTEYTEPIILNFN